MERSWPDWSNLVLGLWLIVAPFTMPHPLTGSAALNAYAVGVLIAAVSVGALSAFQMWEEWTNMILGVWLIAAPWALGFSSLATATWNQAIVGILVVVFAITGVALRGGYEPHKA